MLRSATLRDENSRDPEAMDAAGPTLRRCATKSGSARNATGDCIAPATAAARMLPVLRDRLRQAERRCATESGSAANARDDSAAARDGGAARRGAGQRGEHDGTSALRERRRRR